MENIPLEPEKFTPELFTELVGEVYPGTGVEGVEIVDVKRYGEPMVSSSMRIILDLKYNADAPNFLPRRVMAKMSASDDVWCARLDALYENEVNFYKQIRPGIEIEAPMMLGGHFDKVSRRYILLLEDIRQKSGHPNMMLDETSVADVESVLDTHARLHAMFWETPRFEEDLAWVQTHLKGDVEALMHDTIRDAIRDCLEKYKFRRELVGRLNTSEAEMYAGVCAVKKHFATLPQTLLHGDSHLGNSYLVPGGAGGLYDWQLFVRGYLMHDIGYFITTALSIAERRRSERHLLSFYRDRLRAYGVANPPDPDQLWLEYRRQQLWNFYLGWLPCPEVNYGWQMLVIAHQRTAAAMEDLETMKAVAPLV